MSSKVAICNLALSRLGGTRITSLSDNTEEARLCNLMFDPIAEEVMSEGAWTRATVRTSLARTSNTPSFGFTYEYQLPTVPRVLKVLNINDTVPGTIDYRIESDKLLIDESSVKIRYIGVITDTESYGPYLTKAIISRLASELAYPLTGQSTTADALYRRYRIDLQEGLSIDGQQGGTDSYSSSSLIEIR